MRAAAKVEPVALLVDRDRFARRDDVVDDLRLIVFADLLERRDGVLFRPDFPNDRVVLVDDLFHLLLDALEILRGERLLAREVVIEAVIDHRADRDLRIRIHFLHSLRENVGGVVPDELKALLVTRRHDGNFGVAVQRTVEVIEFPVHLGGKRSLGEGFGNGFRNIGRACPVLILARRSIW